MADLNLARLVMDAINTDNKMSRNSSETVDIYRHLLIEYVQ